MTSRPLQRTILLVLLVAVAFSSGATTVAADDSDLSVSGATETPTRTITIDGTSYEIGAYATVQPGDPLDVDVTTADETFHVDLYNSDKQDVDFKAGTGSDRVTFETDSLEPGTYVLALYVDGSYVDIHPVVVEGYDVTVEAPTDVSADAESITVTADVTQTVRESDPAGVEIAVWDDDTVVREAASSHGDGQYEATVSTADLETGSYSVSAVAQGTKTIDGTPEVLGVSNTRSLSVSDSGADDPDGGDDGPGDGTDDPDNETDDGSVDDDGDTADGDGSDETDDGDTSNADNESDSGPTNESDPDVQQPNLEDENTSSENADEDSDAVPVSGVSLIALAALVVGLSVRARR